MAPALFCVYFSKCKWYIFLSEQVSKVEFDKFLEGDIITFKEGISREVSCSADTSIPAADVNIKVGGKVQTGISQHSEVNYSF